MASSTIVMLEAKEFSVTIQRVLFFFYIFFEVITICLLYEINIALDAKVIIEGMDPPTAEYLWIPDIQFQSALSLHTQQMRQKVCFLFFYYYMCLLHSVAYSKETL